MKEFGSSEFPTRAEETETKGQGLSTDPDKMSQTFSCDPEKAIYK